MAIEIVPKPKKIGQKISALDMLYYLVIILLLITFFSYFVLSFFIQRSEQKLTEIKTAILQKQVPEIKTLEQEVISKQKKIHAFADLLDSHKKISGFFTFLKQNCSNEVIFSKVELDSEMFKAAISGSASSFITLGEQIIIFQEQELIESIDLSSVSLGQEGRIGFTLQAVLEPEIFK